MGGWFGTVIDSVGNIYSSVGDGFLNLGNKFSTVLDYLNPTSDNFFLKTAFIPSSDFMQVYNNDFNNALTEKFSFFYQLRDTFDSLVSSIQSNVDSWQGVKVNFTNYGIGEITIIDPTFANAAIPKIKFWIGGMMYFFTSMWIIRKVSNVMGSGK